METIELAIGLAEKAAGLVSQLIDAAQQSGELTAEQAAAFKARMEAAFASDAWKTDDARKQG